MLPRSATLHVGVTACRSTPCIYTTQPTGRGAGWNAPAQADVTTAHQPAHARPPAVNHPAEGRPAQRTKGGAPAVPEHRRARKVDPVVVDHLR